MTTLDHGHKYLLKHLDGDSVEILTFVKRVGPGFPGNTNSHPGTNLQEVFRACIDRVKYLQLQVPCMENKLLLTSLRVCIWALESRAAARHGRPLDPRANDTDAIEHLPTCAHCGHIGCPEEKKGTNV